MATTLKTVLALTRDTTANWNRYPHFIPKLGEIIVYTDHYTIIDANNVVTNIADIKIGDGRTTLANLPFIGQKQDLGDLAYKNSVDGEYTPEGTITGATFNGNTAYITLSGTPRGTVNVTSFTDEVYVATNQNGNGSVNAGQSAACSFPSLNMTVDGETLNVNWVNGSFKTNIPTQVTLPTFENVNVVNNVEANFEGEHFVLSGMYTPEGTITGETFNGTTAVISAS